jgi:hypothetical protein
MKCFFNILFFINIFYSNSNEIQKMYDELPKIKEIFILPADKICIESNINNAKHKQYRSDIFLNISLKNIKLNLGLFLSKLILLPITSTILTKYIKYGFILYFLGPIFFILIDFLFYYFNPNNLFYYCKYKSFLYLNGHEKLERILGPIKISNYISYYVSINIINYYFLILSLDTIRDIYINNNISNKDFLLYLFFIANFLYYIYYTYRESYYTSLPIPIYYLYSSEDKTKFMNNEYKTNPKSTYSDIIIFNSMSVILYNFLKKNQLKITDFQEYDKIKNINMNNFINQLKEFDSFNLK